MHLRFYGVSKEEDRAVAALPEPLPSCAKIKRDPELRAVPDVAPENGEPDHHAVIFAHENNGSRSRGLRNEPALVPEPGVGTGESAPVFDAYVSLENGLAQKV